MGEVRDFILVTHTRWDEAPRLRHQVARLIAGAGHRVLFIERADGVMSSVPEETNEVEPRIFVTRGKRFLHHQFRIFPPLDWINTTVVRRHLRRMFEKSGFQKSATVINFTHDYAFLREMFPQSELITIIHDDFEAQTRMPGFGHVTRMLRETCLASDRVFALSSVIRDRLREWVNAEIFYPWSTVPYRAPKAERAQLDTLLFWGFIDVGVDTDAVRRVSAHLETHHPNLRILMVGPTQIPSRRHHTTRHLERLRNVDIWNATPLDRLPMNRVLAAFIPYRRKGDADAVELPNKALPLLAHGLPILKTGMPNAVHAPFIISVEDNRALDDALRLCRTDAELWQPLIREFLNVHCAEARLRSLRIEPVTPPP